MPYIKFNGYDTQYPAQIMPFTTQHGIKAIRIISDEIPVRETGFRYYENNGTILGDYSDYRYYYENNSYSIEKDEIVYGGGSDAPLPPSPMAIIQNQIAAANRHISSVSNSLNQEIMEITPYTETKTAYIDDTEIVFETGVQGIISVNAINRDKETVPVTFERDGNKIIVSFDPLVEVTDITISIQ